MAKINSLQQGCDVDGDYIDIEISSSPRVREFEFQMCANSKGKETSTCTADELFYKGKLLPLHIITNYNSSCEMVTKEALKELDIFCSMPLFKKTCATAPCTNTNNSPLDSCNISPSESCRVSCELNPDDYFFEWSAELSSFINNRDHGSVTGKKSWSKKLKLMRHSFTFAQKLKALRAYLKSLFNKSACSDDTCAKGIDNLGDEKINTAKKHTNNMYLELGGKKKPFEKGGASYPTIAAILKNGIKTGIEDTNVGRRSFSGAIKRHSPTKCLSSSSSSSNSSSSSSLTYNGLNEVNLTRRSSSATETEVSIEAAIAHCKKSHKVSDLLKEPEICSLSASYNVDEKDQGRTGPCSI